MKKKKKSDLLNPTPYEKKYRNRMWAEALMKNKKKAIGEMYSDNGGRCCLAVAQDVAISCGVNIPRCGDGELPYEAVKDFFGWGGRDPYLFIPVANSNAKEGAAELNDDLIYAFGTSKGMSHKKIAECVLNTFVHPSKKVWSFKLNHTVEEDDA